jgi:hypothetical protein
VTRRVVGRDAGRTEASDPGLRGHGEAKVGKEKEEEEMDGVAELVTAVRWLAMYCRATAISVPWWIDRLL